MVRNGKIGCQKGRKNMRKGRNKLYHYAFLLVLAINVLLSFTIYRPEIKAIKDAYWENPWYGLIGGVLLQGLLVAFLLLYTFEVGRKKGIKEMADAMYVDPDDYLDYDEKIMVTEKHTLDSRRRTYAKALKYGDGDD
jgi:phosphoglycerol transferase MdoB-like AlkP superfamily enzyme